MPNWVWNPTTGRYERQEEYQDPANWGQQGYSRPPRIAPEGGRLRRPLSTKDRFGSYMQAIYGAGGPEQYVKRQVQGVSDVMNPYLQSISKQAAANLSARGGLAGGAQDVYLGDIAGRKATALSQAGTQAQQDVTQTIQNMLGLSEQTGLALSAQDIQRFLAELEKRKLQMDWSLANRQYGPFQWLFGMSPESGSIDWGGG